MSIRLPLYSTVLDSPPISLLYSITIGVIPVRIASSYAAVSPAGPAPIMMAVLFIFRNPEAGNAFYLLSDESM